MKSKFDYGQEVRYSPKTDPQLPSERKCIVVGITKVSTEEQSNAIQYPIGTVLYTVEFGDGSDMLVPEANLDDSV